MMRRRTILVLAMSLFAAREARGGGPSFDRQAKVLAPQACGGSGCWTNHLRVTDLDRDGDLDIVLANYGDFFMGVGAPQPLVVYANDGVAGFTNVSTAAVGDYAGNLRQIAIGDVDGDGFPDIYAPDGTGGPHVLFINDGRGAFTDEADLRLAGLEFPASAAARMGDVDNDGDLDIFVADGYAGGGPPYGHLYINDGTGTFDEPPDRIPMTITGTSIDDAEFVDVDRDFDLDLIVNAHEGGIGALWINDGAGTFAAGGTLAPPASSNFHYNVSPCDVDGDGDLDLWIDNIGGNFTEQLQINDGVGHFSDETTSRVAGNPSADDNGVICADVDDDGDFDGIVLSLAGPERLLQNDGTGHFSYVAGVFPQPGDCTLWGELGDLNGDHRPDLVTGQGECSSSDEVDLANLLIAADARGPRIVAVNVPAQVEARASAVIRFAVAARTSSDEGPRIARAWLVVEPEAEASEVTAWAMGGDLFRVEAPPKMGTVTVVVCAADPAGNQGCSEPMTYNAGDTGDATSTSDSGGGAGISGSTMGVAPATEGAASSGGAGQTTGVVSSTAGEPAGDSKGCGCAHDDGPQRWPLWGVFGIVLLRWRRNAGPRDLY